MPRAYRLLGWGFVAIALWFVVRAPAPVAAIAQTQVAQTNGTAPVTIGNDAESWFRRAKPYCNAVEINVLQNREQPPATTQGAAYHAACFALAGKIDDARRIIDKLPQGERFKAAGVVFDIGHPVADAGDDKSAGPIMELVIDYWPNHYMALYHAGMAEYMLGQRDVARKNLTEFLQQYHENDGWRRNGIEVLKRLNDSTGTANDVKRPREPGA